MSGSSKNIWTGFCRLVIGGSGDAGSGRTNTATAAAAAAAAASAGYVSDTIQA